MPRPHLPSGNPRPRSRNSAAAWDDAPSTRKRSPSRIRVGDDREGNRLHNMSAALLARLRGTEPTGVAQLYANLPLSGFEVLCRARGQSLGVTLSGGTTDFSWLLGDVLRKRALDFYRTEEPSARILTIAVGGVAPLELANQHAEISYGALVEGGEPVALASYGKILSWTRQALENDDLGSLDDLARLAVQAVNALEDDLMFESLLSASGAGPTLRDGIALFHASHNNLLAGAALTAANLGLATSALRQQTSIDSTRINMAPAILLVGPDLEVTARSLVVDITAPTETPLRVVADPHITDAAFYVLATPATRPAFVRGYLNANGAPTIVARTGFQLDGFEFRVSADVGIGVADHRPIVRTPAV
jgi:hypothetical protein